MTKALKCAHPHKCRLAGADLSEVEDLHWEPLSVGLVRLHTALFSKEIG
jgi:hypothetical protein